MSKFTEMVKMNKYDPSQEMYQRLLELENRVSKIETEQQIFNKLQQENNKHTDNQLISQTDIIKIMKGRLDKHDEELSLIIHNDTGQDEAIDKVKASLDNLISDVKAHEEFLRKLDEMQNTVSDRGDF